MVVNVDLHPRDGSRGNSACFGRFLAINARKPPLKAPAPPSARDQRPAGERGRSFITSAIKQAASSSLNGPLISWTTERYGLEYHYLVTDTSSTDTGTQLRHSLLRWLNFSCKDFPTRDLTCPRPGVPAPPGDELVERGGSGRAGCLLKMWENNSPHPGLGGELTTKMYNPSLG